MQPPDVTNDPTEWELVKREKTDAGEPRKPLWQNKNHPDIFSSDGGKTFTIATERYDPDIPRTVRDTRKVV